MISHHREVNLIPPLLTSCVLRGKKNGLCDLSIMSPHMSYPESGGTSIQQPLGSPTLSHIFTHEHYFLHCTYIDFQHLAFDYRIGGYDSIVS